MSRLSNMFSMSTIDGTTTISLPNPEKDSARNTILTLVDSSRGIEGTLTAQKKGRDQEKTELSWSHLDKDIWEQMLAFWDSNFYFNFTYYNRVSGAKITRVFYVGDRTDKPHDIDSNGVPTSYDDCKANVIDTGVTA